MTRESADSASVTLAPPAPYRHPHLADSSVWKQMFFDDARRAAPLLGLALSHRAGAPMCGIPYYCIDTYLARIVHAGMKAALADTMESQPRPGALPRREITRVIGYDGTDLWDCRGRVIATVPRNTESAEFGHSPFFPRVYRNAPRSVSAHPWVMCLLFFSGCYSGTKHRERSIWRSFAGSGGFFCPCLQPFPNRVKSLRMPSATA